MHLLNAQQRAKLEANRRGLDHYNRNEKTYQGYAGAAIRFSTQYPALNEQSRVFFVQYMILSLDRAVWQLGQPYMSVEELALIYALSVVGHER
jgi:hypothetical protein